MTKKMGCLGAFLIATVVGLAMQSASKSPTSVSISAPATPARTNAKTDEHGLLRPGFYVCAHSYELAKADALWKTDQKAAAVYAGQVDCHVSTAGRAVIVDGIPAFGYKTMHYTGEPKTWYLSADGVAGLSSRDAESLTTRKKATR